MKLFIIFVGDDDDDDKQLHPAIIQQEKQTSSSDEIANKRQAISLTKIQSSFVTSTLFFNPIDDKVLNQHHGFLFQIDFESLLHKNSESEYDGNPSPVSNAIGNISRTIAENIVLTLSPIKRAELSKVNKYFCNASLTKSRMILDVLCFGEREHFPHQTSRRHYRCGLYIVVVVYSSFVVNDDQSDSACSFDRRTAPPIERALHLLGREGKGGSPRAPFSFSDISLRHFIYPIVFSI